MFMNSVRILLLTILSAPAFSQNAEPAFSLGDRYISSAGIVLPRANHNHHDEQFYGICYSPSLNMLNKFSDFSVSIASKLSASYHFKTNNDPSGYMMFSFPAYLQFNAGHLATHNFYSSLGISFGAGYNFSVINSEFDLGPLLITTIHFWFLKQSFTVGYAQTYFQNQLTLMHELSLQLNIGAYLRDVNNNNVITKFVKPFRKR